MRTGGIVRWRVLGRPQTKTFTRRHDADAFRRTVEAEKLRGLVVDVRHRRTLSGADPAHPVRARIAAARVPRLPPPPCRRVAPAHLTEVQEQDTRDGTATTGTKNDSSRWTTLPPFVIDALTEHLDGYSQPGADGYIFTGPAGGAISRSHWYKSFDRARQAVGMAELHPMT
jgi:hypothetical protein